MTMKFMRRGLGADAVKLRSVVGTYSMGLIRMHRGLNTELSILSFIFNSQ